MQEQWEGAEGEGLRVPSQLHTKCRAQYGTLSHDPEIMMGFLIWPSF